MHGTLEWKSIVNDITLLEMAEYFRPKQLMALGIGGLADALCISEDEHSESSTGESDADAVADS